MCLLKLPQRRASDLEFKWYAPWLCDQLESFMWYAPWLCVQLEAFMWYAPWLCVQLEVSIMRMLRLKEVARKTVGMHLEFAPEFFEYGVSTSTGYGVSSSLSNIAYSSQQINTAYPLPLDTGMTKVIKGEFEKIKDIKVEDDSLACDSPLEVFNYEVSRLSKMDDDLFTYKVEIANIPCDLRVDDDSEHEADDIGFDPSDIAFTKWLGSKFFNYKTMDHYTMKALWIYWIKGDDEVELTDEEFSDNKDEIAEVFRIDTNIFDYETPICSAFNKFNYLLKVDPDLLTKDIMGFKTYDDYKDDWIYECNKDVPWVDEKP
ncbi:hypothetical protein Tco_0419316 [Tanacetum coccineum]